MVNRRFDEDLLAAAEYLNAYDLLHKAENRLEGARKRLLKAVKVGDRVRLGGRSVLHIIQENLEPNNDAIFKAGLWWVVTERTVNIKKLRKEMDELGSKEARRLAKIKRVHTIRVTASTSK